MSTTFLAKTTQVMRCRGDCSPRGEGSAGSSPVDWPLCSNGQQLSPIFTNLFFHAFLSILSPRSFLPSFERFRANLWSVSKKPQVLPKLMVLRHVTYLTTTFLLPLFSLLTLFAFKPEMKLVKISVSTINDSIT